MGSPVTELAVMDASLSESGGGMDVLLFTLAAPLASFGDVAPGERRVSASRPGRSMLVGLLAAALGLRRDDPRQQAFAASLAFAVRIDRLGSVVNDYHTTQTAPAKKNRRFATRRQELEADDLGTILSQREYRMDSAFTVAVLADGAPPFTLAEIAAALRRPHFLLSAGRRACPLGLPPEPHIVVANTLAGAFAIHDRMEGEGAEDTVAARARLRLAMGLRAPRATSRSDVAVDARFAALGLVDGGAGRMETRRDEPVSRTRWQFSPRAEQIVSLAPEAAP
jgi:CRISPR system Cascade subunit CasD